MGTTAAAGGAITLTCPSALCRRSRLSPWTRSAGVFGLTFAMAQICPATAGEMREKSSTSTCLTVLPSTSR